MTDFRPLLYPMTCSIACLFTLAAFAQSPDWQQRAEYTMDIDMDAEKHQYSGTQTLVYYNNSPDELDKVYYHLYFNAFRPGSMMDIRSRTISDPDKRVGDRIAGLSKDEIGYIKVNSLTQDGRTVDYKEVGTVLEVELAEPIPSGGQATFEMSWDAQVPLQIRRSGRDNAEGVEFSMTQWYPKMAEYDYKGWHADPYVGREFYGVWGDFDVTIHMDKDYTIGGSGYLQNAEEVGHGYAEGKGKAKGGRLTWHFKAPMVHDFAWAADRDYIHDVLETADGPTLHFLYQDDEEIKPVWKEFQPYVERIFSIASKTYGTYPYEQYSVIQGGDGGMEYAMATLITGKRNLGSLVGVTAHEALHSWYQMVLATDEGNYGWMDEGFTSYASQTIEAQLFDDVAPDQAYDGAYRGYNYIVKSGKEEALSGHSDMFETNQAYGIAVYSKGEVFLNQLSYIIGQEALDRTMLAYFDQWKFRHPEPYDFIRVAEKESDMELDWYLENWMNTTRSIDYSIRSVRGEEDGTVVILTREGGMMMPIDVRVTYTDGHQETMYIPLRIMRGEKPRDAPGDWTQKEDWPWTNPAYELRIDAAVDRIERIEIDPSRRMADVNRDNNLIELNGEVDYFFRSE